ncbi:MULTISPECIES: glycosyltransferase family 4 protein [unclassified Haloferax]|uniref:glycosyltransferase family 4 protein n=1 Tax=unclassified Haloferax TaxID=2625095 RepID=UPI0009DB213A|nr:MULTISPECIES: glycosyltransferase family 4 protein [unclassified Haloferax]
MDRGKSPTILIRSSRSLHQPPAGGAGRLMCNIARALSESNWEVNILCPRPKKEYKETVLGDYANYHTFPYTNPTTSVGRLAGSVRGIRSYRSVSNTVKPDIILDDISHIPFYPAHFFNGGATNSVFMHTAFFNEAWNFNGSLKGTVVNLIDRLLPYMGNPAVICASESTKMRIAEHTRINHGSILNPCIDISRYPYQFNPESKRILYLGRLTPRKNVSCLIKAWAKIDPEFTDYTLSIAGTGSREDSLRELANQLDIDNIEFHGYVDEKEKERLYQDSLLFVVPSLMEGYMTTGIEALASGTPVVGSNTHGIRDYIEHEENGYLFDIDDERDLADMLERALSDPHSLQRLAENGRKLAENHRFEIFKPKADRIFRGLV